jgi:hypothetical protein
MRLWTIQRIEAWRELRQSGLLRTNRRYVEHDVLPAYQWMAQQMSLRLDSHPQVNSLPLWIWYQWEGKGRNKPDLRSAGHLPKHEHGVLIDFEIDDRLVLLSDFEQWHYVLNYWYLPRSEADGEAFERELSKRGLSFYETKPIRVRKIHHAIEKSWERIFQLKRKDGKPADNQSIQGTIWELRVDMVRNIQLFTAR